MLRTLLFALIMSDVCLSYITLNVQGVETQWNDARCLNTWNNSTRMFTCSKKRTLTGRMKRYGPSSGGGNACFHTNQRTWLGTCFTFVQKSITSRYTCLTCTPLLMQTTVYNVGTFRSIWAINDVVCNVITWHLIFFKYGIFLLF